MKAPAERIIAATARIAEDRPRALLYPAVEAALEALGGTDVARVDPPPTPEEP